MECGDQFESIQAAKEAINRYVLDNGESFKVKRSDKKQYHIIYKEHGCGFSIRIATSSKEVVSITSVMPHICSPIVYYNNQHTHVVSYLIEHHYTTIIDNHKITPT